MFLVRILGPISFFFYNKSVPRPNMRTFLFSINSAIFVASSRYIRIYVNDDIDDIATPVQHHIHQRNRAYSH